MDCSRQAPLSLKFSRQEYWSRLPFLSPGDLSDPGIKARSPALQANTLPPKPPPGNRSHSGCVLMVNAGSSWEGQKHPTPCLLRTLTPNWCAINSTRVRFTRTNGKAKSNISGAENYNPVYHSVGKNELSNRIRMGCSKFPKLHPSSIIQNCLMFTWTCMKSPC